MIILRQKEFGFKDVMKSGIKGASFGAQGGLLLSAPFALLARIFGQKRASMIIAGIGAGIGLYFGIDMQLGKERPKTKEEIEKEKKELLKYIKVNATTYSISSNQVKKEYKDLEKKLGIEFEPCVYEYIDFICNFYNKYHKRWYDSYKVLDNLFQTDVEFEYIFSFPDANFSYEVSNISEGSMVIAGDPSLRDHSWCFWEIKEGIYDYPLGFGHEGKTLGESVSKMAEGWIVKDLNKIKETGVRQVAEEHNKILQEFINKVPK